MKKIKDLEKLYKGEIKEVLDRIDATSKEIDAAKALADELHGRMVEKAKESGFGDFVELSKEIVDLKKEQKKAFDEFVKYKEEFKDINDLLKAKINDASRIKELVEEREVEIKRDRQKRSNKDMERLDAKNKKVMAAKRKIAEEKLSKGEKLNTDDFLALQSEE